VIFHIKGRINKQEAETNLKTFKFKLRRDRISTVNTSRVARGAAAAAAATTWGLGFRVSEL